MVEAPRGTTAPSTEPPAGGWRFPVGVTIFVLGFAAPLAIPLVASSGLPTGWKTAIAGALAVGVPEVMMVLAAAVMGKEGFARLKSQFGRFLKRSEPPQQYRNREHHKPGAVAGTVHMPMGLGHRQDFGAGGEVGSNPIELLLPARDSLSGSLSLTSTRVRLRLVRRRPHGGPPPIHGGHA